MDIFDLEFSIKDKISNNVVSVACSILDTDKIAVANISNKNNVISFLNVNGIGEDTLWFPAILVTTNWNKNDDVFTPKDTWNARKSPLGKPVNWQHKGNEDNNQIIGVINGCVPIDENYGILPDSIDISTIDKFHIAIGCNIWKKYFPSYAQEIEERLPLGNLFVSMECKFDDFGYAIRKDDSEDVILINRNAKNAWLTQFLKAYGGLGTVKIDGLEYRIGRWLKKITFTAVGCVNNPGNPESIILTDSIIVESNISISENLDFSKICENCVLSIVSDVGHLNKSETMAEAKETKCSCNAESLAEKLKDMESECSAMKETIAKLESEAKAKDELFASKASELEAISNKEKELLASLTKANESLASVNSELAKIQKEKIGAVRLAEMKSFNAVADEAKAFDQLASMSDETYAATREFAMASFKNTAKADVNTDNTKNDDIEKSIKELENAKSSDETSSMASASAKNEDLATSFIKFMQELSVSK